MNSVTSKDTFDIVPPQAASLVESLRAFGYSLPTAIADLVDNSITANANKIWIDFHWNGASSMVSITDNGHGMNDDEIVQAMRLGSQNPRDERTAQDLGRFGLGLKTASFSQCRRVTVKSLTKTLEVSTRCWDLDYIAKTNEWRLLSDIDTNAEPFFQRLEGLAHGTSVLWQKLDRLTSGQRTECDGDQQVFLRKIDEVKNYLSVVFHRLVEGGIIKLFVNNNPVVPWDPYLASEMATQRLPEENLDFQNGFITVAPFVLPHHSKLSPGDFKRAGGIRGWNAHQGFYVYRNKRLLVVGDWLGMGWAKEEHYKLARIRIDIPNKFDHDWAIDVTKSKAVPPHGLRSGLRRIGERTRNEAKKVYSFRGAKLTPQDDKERMHLWEPITKHGKVSYRLNREHPLLVTAQKTCTNRDALNALLRLIEETVPCPHIAITSNEQPESIVGPFESSNKDISNIMKQAYISLLSTGYSQADALNRLRTLWPFELFPELLQTMAEEVNHA